MSSEDFLTALIGGLVGGSVSAFVTWLWTHKKWDRTAMAFKTTARYIARLILDPESVGDLREDEKGWLRGFDQIIRIGIAEETKAAGTVTAEKSQSVGGALETDEARPVGRDATRPEETEENGESD